jgi:hypothetical protein
MGASLRNLIYIDVCGMIIDEDLKGGVGDKIYFIFLGGLFESLKMA